MKRDVRSFARLAGFPLMLTMLLAVVAAACGGPAADAGAKPAGGAAAGGAPMGDMARGRVAVLSHGCGDCHGGFANPAAKGFLAGVMSPFRPGGPQPGSHLGYSPWCVPTSVGATKCVIIHRDLRDYDVMAWDFCINFAKDNELQVSETPPGVAPVEA